MKALVVGGTGPTGPFLVNGLLQRGYTVSILHRGTHEIPEIPPEVEHIHADPHFRETLDEALAGRSFDLVIATYGRIRFAAEALVGKTPHFIGIGGVACYRGYMQPERNSPAGLTVPIPESAPLVASEEELRFSYLIAMTEEVVLQCHPTAAFFRYPYVYGPYQLVPREWCVIRRILDKRPFIILPDGGLMLSTHGYAANLAHAVLLAVDKPEASAGQIYNCGDEQVFTLHQWVEVIARTMNYQWDIISLPNAVAAPARPLAMQATSHHRVVDLSKIKNQLGYKDPFPVEEALAKTVHWYLEHPPERGGEIERRLQDPFNYAVEDQLVAVFTESLKRMAAIPFEVESTRPHPYAHPKVPGQQRDHRDR
ncbi:MAG: epimerase [Deltaproteobacteria bacterium]|nr:epimerase [Deltaproteobacteria bacterium]